MCRCAAFIEEKRTKKKILTYKIFQTMFANSKYQNKNLGTSHYNFPLVFINIAFHLRKLCQNCNINLLVLKKLFIKTESNLKFLKAAFFILCPGKVFSNVTQADTLSHLIFPPKSRTWNILHKVYIVINRNLYLILNWECTCSQDITNAFFHE